jgi:DNA-binding transcriptional regulator YiaG
MTPKGIIRLRKKLKLTQQQLADMIGSQRHTVSRWESGENEPRGANLKALTELQKKAKAKKK